jgi:protein associated with RNAse G/E
LLGQNYIVKLQKQPFTTAIGYRQTVKVFSDEARKKLDIPDFIEEYNLFICSVDVADQLRSYYNTERTYMKT